ncbi:MAG: hypothetical protein LH616_15710 [Ilumatobacteraceae bacterium]|nr:hypothetical protein [Ilumatobacteraceae bacterium]
MQQRRSRTLLAISLVSLVTLAACGDDETTDTADTTAAVETTTATEETAAPDTTVATEETAAPDTSGGEASGALTGVCPDTVIIQTDWMPEAEHGFLYNLVGDGYEMDAGKAYVTGPLLDSEGVDTGVDIQVRSGGSPQQFSPVTQLLYNDDDILLGFVYTDEAIQFSGSEFPTVAVMSGFEKNPQMIMWDPATYPDVTGIADLGTEGVTVRYFGGAAYMDFLTATGVLSKEQVDGSYTGDPALFIADEGKAAQQGFGSAEPYLYENELTDWGKPVKYEYINDIGWRNYAQSIATKPENIEKYADCLTVIVPMIQQSAVDYLTDPAHGNEVILAAVESFGGDFGWDYTAGAADFGVKTIKADGLQANGTDGTMGSFDMDRVAELIDLAIPVYTAQGATPKDGLVPDDIVTNQFIDASIKL